MLAIPNQAHLHGEHARTTAAASRGPGSRDDAACQARHGPPTTAAAAATETATKSKADAAARANYGSGFGSLGLEKVANLLSGGKFLQPNFSKPVVADNGKKIKLVDGLSVAQGPN